jgi:2-oxoacid dehydrogenases acyltransferase (catalytic domain)
VHEGALAIRQVATLALSFDHRFIDGELGAQVLGDIGAVLTRPLLLIARALPQLIEEPTTTGGVTLPSTSSKMPGAFWNSPLGLWCRVE